MSDHVIKKKAIPMGVEPDTDNHSIIVRYEMQVIYGDNNGKQTRVLKQQAHKTIKMAEFEKDDVNDLADELIRSCNLINPQKREILIKSLLSLITGQKVITLAGNADMQQLDQYIDSLYDDLNMKIEATGKILMLAQDRNNLPEMADNDVLLSALARCLREDGLKSIELGTNIVHIFYIISHY